MGIPEILTMFKDICLAIAAIVTASVAGAGLHVWRRELEGTAHFKVARNLARGTYKLRDELRKSRSQIIWATEFPKDYTPDASDDEEARAFGHVYKNRWDPVWTAIQEFDVCTLEAEALLGEAIRVRTEALLACARTLNAAMQMVVDDKRQGGAIFKADRKFGQQIRATVAASPNDDQNILNREITSAVKGIEDEIRPHLGRT